MLRVRDRAQDTVRRLFRVCRVAGFRDYKCRYIQQPTLESKRDFGMF